MLWIYRTTPLRNLRGHTASGEGALRAGFTLELRVKSLCRALIEKKKYRRARRSLFVHDDAVVVLATSVTAATRVLAVLADATVSVGHVTAVLPSVLKACRLPTHRCDQKPDARPCPASQPSETLPSRGPSQGRQQAQ